MLHQVLQVHLSPLLGALKARMIQFLSKELLVLSTYEKHLLHEFKRVGRQKKEVTALLRDLKSTSVADDNEGA